MIVFDKITKTFPLGNTALDSVSFTIEENEFVFLVGPSGAGKTTILKLILREMDPTSGSLMVDDFDLSDKKIKHLANLRREIGIVFQDFKVLPDKNVFENIALGLEVVHTPVRRIKEEVTEALKLVGLPEKKLMFPIQLSAGELQRVAIARAICGDRKILLADEPTGNLDLVTTWDIIKIFKKIEGKRTIIIATHNPDIVNSLKKRVLSLKSGKLVKDVRKGGYDL